MRPKSRRSRRHRFNPAECRTSHGGGPQPTDFHSRKRRSSRRERGGASANLGVKRGGEHAVEGDEAGRRGDRIRQGQRQPAAVLASGPFLSVRRWSETRCSGFSRSISLSRFTSATSNWPNKMNLGCGTEYSRPSEARRMNEVESRPEAGRMPLPDSFLAATARRHRLTLVTCNVADSAWPGLKVFMRLRMSHWNRRRRGRDWCRDTEDSSRVSGERQRADARLGSRALAAPGRGMPRFFGVVTRAIGGWGTAAPLSRRGWGGI